MKNHKAFTLVEMLIVLGIVAILVAVVVSVLNPAEFFRQTRDSRRLSDLNQLDQALNLATLDNVSMGTASVVYVSIPDSSATCANLGLPASSTLGVGWDYACSNSTNYRKVDGTGWVPVNFSSLVTVPSALNVLPIDPTNATSSNLFYTYISGSWELTSLFESTKYTTKYPGFGTSTVYTLGNHQGISPSPIAMRAGTSEGGSPTIVVPTLTTSAATNVLSTTATLNGSITNEGNASSTIIGFDYGLTTSYGSQATSTYSGGTGAFSKGITGLVASTLYHFRAKSYNSAGWGYGSDTTLTTSAPAFSSAYPPTQSDTYVKATSKASTVYWPYYATDPAKTLVGNDANTNWVSAAGSDTNQRFHIDLGSSIVVKRIYYENFHNSGGSTNVGAKNFTFWGSNTAGDFADLVYADNGTWTQLTTSQSTFDQHVSADQTDPKYITVTNTTAYRYYAFKFVDTYGNGTLMGVRRIELQVFQ